MKQKSLLFSLIILVIFNTDISAMKRSRTYSESTIFSHNKRQKLHSQKDICLLHLSLLAQELIDMILVFRITCPNTHKPREATQFINTLAVTNKYLNQTINTPKFSDTLIKNLANTFSCSQESIAKFLHTKASKERLALQCALKNLFFENDPQKIESKLIALIAQNVDLNFTYNNKDIPQTPLMLTRYWNTHMYSLLLKKGANINSSNAQGITALHFSMRKPINYVYCNQLLRNPNIDVHKTNNRGENTLLYALRCKKNSITPLHLSFITLIKNLLDAGVDPELADKKGITPLHLAKSKGYPPLIKLIEDAITAKHKRNL